MTRQPTKDKRKKTEEPEEVPEGYLTAEAITTQESAEEDWTIKGLGKIRIRALNRDGAHRVSNEDDNRKREMIIVQEGVIVPQLKWAEVGAWFAGPQAGQIQDLVIHLTEISGLGDEAEAEDVERFLPEPEQPV